MSSEVLGNGLYHQLFCVDKRLPHPLKCVGGGGGGVQYRLKCSDKTVPCLPNCWSFCSPTARTEHSTTKIKSVNFALWWGTVDAEIKVHLLRSQGFLLLRLGLPWERSFACCQELCLSKFCLPGSFHFMLPSPLPAGKGMCDYEWIGLWLVTW